MAETRWDKHTDRMLVRNVLGSYPDRDVMAREYPEHFLPDPVRFITHCLRHSVVLPERLELTHPMSCCTLQASSSNLAAFLYPRSAANCATTLPFQFPLTLRNIS